MMEDASAYWTASSGEKHSILSQLMNIPPEHEVLDSECNGAVASSYKAAASSLSATIIRRLENANLSAEGGGGVQTLCASDLLCECGADGRILGSATAYVLKWTKVAIRKSANAYLSNPVLLALTPLLLGLVVGFLLGRSWDKKNRVWVGERPSEEKKIHSESILTKVVALLPLLHMALTTTKEVSLHIATKGVAELMGFACSKDDEGQSMRSVSSASGRSGESTTATATTNEADVSSSAARVDDQEERDSRTRTYLLSDAHTLRESGVDQASVPRHVAVIMDGNRRYGRARYGSATRGHWDGSRTLVDFSKWCIAEGIGVLTVYAFSTENWNRSREEVDALMKIFVKYCDELRAEAIQRDIRLRVLSTETERIPEDVKAGLKRMVEDTSHCTSFLLNICLSYGGRGEIVNACRSIAQDVQQGSISLDDVTEKAMGEKMLTFVRDGSNVGNDDVESCPPDPDVVIRTSGELRLSNFLLWQAAYSELFFVDKPWPALQKEDLLNVIRSYALGRKRRFGK